MAVVLVDRTRRDVPGRARRALAAVGLADHWPAWIGAAVTLVLGLYALGRPDALAGIHGYAGNGYDDGVYLGSAIRLTHGVLPWVDYTFLHPPGITWLMTPFAIVGRITSERDALVLARIATALVAAANTYLAAMVVRSRGRAAMSVAAGAMSVYPLTIAATHSVMLEPYLVLCCLLGAVLLFDGDHLAATPRRLLLAGLAFGFAGAVKIWALLAVIAAVGVLAGRWKDRVRPFALGLVLGFAVPTAPFALAAPRAFLRDVVFAQLNRGTSGRSAYTFSQRLAMMLGVDFVPSADGIARAKWLALALALVLLVAFAAAAVLRWATMLDAYVYGSLALVFVGLLKPPQFYDHYAYFVAAFGAVALGAAASTALDLVHHLAGDTAHGRRSARTVAYVGLAVLALAVAISIPGRLDRTRDYLSTSADPSSVVRAAVPEGSCVASDMPIILLVSDRLGAGSSCTVPMDPFGLWLTDNHGDPPGARPPYPAAFTAKWAAWFEQSDYVVLSVELSNYIPWNAELVRDFRDHFTLVAKGPRTFVYRHTA